MRKAKIPRALREQVWVTHNGTRFSAPCSTPWCQNRITAFDFHVGHNIPESRGGPTILTNLIPLCARCNTSMGAHYTFDEWGQFHTPTYWKWFCCNASTPVEEPVVRRPSSPQRARTSNSRRRVAPAEGEYKSSSPVV